MIATKRQVDSFSLQLILVVNHDPVGSCHATCYLNCLWGRCRIGRCPSSSLWRSKISAAKFLEGNLIKVSQIR
ncbi:hypothetical protein SXCC_04763 [Gluconacetobacter sp. SXCC-1]|nr:hypothetical protein SXCC_04763 [Gluconacetobacter sp. SXCC-1]